MQAGDRPGDEAIRVKGWFGAHRYLILRRVSQLAILALFPPAVVRHYLVKGNMASS